MRKNTIRGGFTNLKGSRLLEHPWRGKGSILFLVYFGRCTHRLSYPVAFLALFLYFVGFQILVELCFCESCIPHAGMQQSTNIITVSLANKSRPGAVAIFTSTIHSELLQTGTSSNLYASAGPALKLLASFFFLEGMA